MPTKPPKARLDADRTAKPKTRLVATTRVRADQRVYCDPATHIEQEDGSRVPLAVNPRCYHPVSAIGCTLCGDEIIQLKAALASLIASVRAAVFQGRADGRLTEAADRAERCLK